jgi:hypothetical protein
VAGRTLGSGSDVWKYSAELRAWRITEASWDAIEERIAASPGHSMTMGGVDDDAAIERHALLTAVPKEANRPETPEPVTV